MNGPALAISGSNLCGDAPFSCCLCIDGELRVASSPPGQRGDVAELARDLLAAAGIAPGDLRELRVDLGPGSYTGLRVAITFVRFVQHFGSVKVLACDSLALLANAAPPSPGSRLRPLLDARRGKFHCAAFTGEDAVLRALEPPRAMPWGEVLDSIASGDTFVVPPLGDDLMRTLREKGAAIHIAATIRADHLFATRLPLAECSPQQLEPRYLMGTYAQQ